MPDFERATVTVVSLRLTRPSRGWRGYGDDVRISGETMRQVRLLAGLSREGVARATGLAYATIVRAERGRDVADGKREARMRKESVERIAQALGVEPGLLIRRIGKVAKGRGRNNEHQGQTVRDGGASGATGARGAHPADGDRVDGDAVQ
jgi:transcriptional regulator with XRE-family HTH domain